MYLSTSNPAPDDRDFASCFNKLRCRIPQKAGFHVLISDPNINGLYLLLRAAGFAVVEGFGSRQKMIIDKAVLQSWQALNSTERYLTLFETWMLKGDPTIIGEHGSLVDTPFMK